jgi:hypothetical protein
MTPSVIKLPWSSCRGHLKLESLVLNCLPDGGAYGVAHGPAHDTARVQVHDHCCIQPAFSRPDVGEVRCPLLVRAMGLEVALQMVGGDMGN